jgi:hypothetical protein
MPPSGTAYTVAEHGSVLTTRPQGREVAALVCAALVQAEVLGVSFAGVEVASRPFLDEFVNVVQDALEQHPDRLLATFGYNASVKENLIAALARHDMVLATLNRGRVGLLGGGAQLRRTLKAAQELGTEFTAADLAERLAVRPPTLLRHVELLLRGGVLAVERANGRSLTAARLRRPRPSSLALLHR